MGAQEGEGGDRELGTIVGEKWHYGLVSKLKVRVGGSVEGEGEQPRGAYPLPAPPPPPRSPSDLITLAPIYTFRYYNK